MAPDLLVDFEGGFGLDSEEWSSNVGKSAVADSRDKWEQCDR